MANAGNVDVNFNANLQRFNRGIDTASRRLERFGRTATTTQGTVSTSSIAMGNAYAMMAQVAVRALAKIANAMADFAVDGSKMAIDMESSLVRMNTVFGDSASDITDFMRDQARALNLSQVQAARYATTFGNLLKNMGKTREETAGYSKQLLTLAAVIKSQESRFSMEQILDKLRSGVLGNVQAIDDLGIEAKIGMLRSTQAFKKFAGDKSWSELSFQTQQQIRLFGILEQGANLYGTTLADTTSTQLGEFNAAMDDAKLALGEGFLPLIQRTIPYLVSFAEWLEKAAEDVGIFMEVVFGEPKKPYENITKGTNNVTTAQGDLENQVKKTDKAIKSSLGSFDEINTLTKMTSGINTTTDVAKAVEQSVPDPMDSFVGPMPKTTVGTRVSAADVINQDLEKIKKETDRFFDNFGLGKEIGWATDWISESFGVLTNPESWSLFWGEVKGAARTTSNTVFQLWDDITEPFWTAVDTLTSAENWSLFWGEVKSTARESSNTLFEAWDSVGEGISSMWEGVREDTGMWWDSIEKRVDTSIEDIKKLKWSDIKTEVGKMWEGTRKDANDWWWSIKQRVKLSIEDITGLKWEVIKEAVNNMWEGVKNTTSAIWTGIKNTVIDSVNFMITKINYLITKFNALKFETPFGTVSGPQVGTIDLLEKEAVPYGGGGGSFAPNGGTSFAEPISEQARATNVNVKVQIGPEELRDIIVTTLEEAREISGSTLFDTSFAGGGN